MSRAVVLLAILAAAGVAQANGLLAPVEPALAPAAPVLAQAGLAGVFAGAPDAPAPDLPGGLVSYDCGGTAPLTTACAQPLTAAPGQQYQLYVDGGTGFTGTVVAALADAAGNSATWTCTYVAFVGGVTPAPQCQSGGSGGPLQGGDLKLTGAVSTMSSGAPSAGYWDVGVLVR